MQSIQRDLLHRIKDAEEGRICNCHRPHLLTFPDVDGSFEILDTKVIEKVNDRVQYIKTEITARCRICGTGWRVEVISSSDRRTRTWERLD